MQSFDETAEKIIYACSSLIAVCSFHYLKSLLTISTAMVAFCQEGRYKHEKIDTHLFPFLSISILRCDLPSFSHTTTHTVSDDDSDQVCVCCM